MLDWYCKKGECRMTKATCIARRNKARNTASSNFQGQGIRNYGCLTCTQFGDENMEEEITQINLNLADQKECLKCHQMKHARHDFRTNKLHPDKRINVCKACEVQMPKVKPPKEKQAEHEFEGVDFRKIGENYVLINLTNYPDLLTHLKGSAYFNFRTAEQQVMYLINKDMVS